MVLRRRLDSERINSKKNCKPCMTFPRWKVQHVCSVWQHSSVAVSAITCVQFPQRGGHFRTQPACFPHVCLWVFFECSASLPPKYYHATRLCPWPKAPLKIWIWSPRGSAVAEWLPAAAHRRAQERFHCLSCSRFFNYVNYDCQLLLLLLKRKLKKKLAIKVSIFFSLRWL